MSIVIETLKKAFDASIDYAILLDVCIFSLNIFNIILGAIIGSNKDKFDVKKFFFGVVKALIMLVIIVGVCYILNVFALTVSMVQGLQIDSQLISTIEMLGVLVSIGADLALEVASKIKEFRSLKYLKYEDIRPIVNNIDISEPEDLRG